jgi:hypothetical protein
LGGNVISPSDASFPRFVSSSISRSTTPLGERNETPWVCSVCPAPDIDRVSVTIRQLPAVRMGVTSPSFVIFLSVLGVLGVLLVF